MKYIKNLSLLTALLFAGSTAFAQLELTFATGYQMGAFKATSPSAKMFTDVNPVNVNSPYGTNIYYSMGGGIPLSLGLNLPITDNLKFNLDLAYLMGQSVTVTDLDITVQVPPPINTNLRSYTFVTAQTSQMRINPGFVFVSDVGLYAKTNLIIPVGGKTVVNIEDGRQFINPADGSVVGENFTKEEWENKGAFTVGMSGAVGMQFPIADGLNLGFEVSATALNIQGASSVIMSFEDEDGNALEDANEYQDRYNREVNYVDQLNGNSNNSRYNSSANMDAPMEDYAQRQSFGSWGFGVRLNYTLGG